MELRAAAGMVPSWATAALDLPVRTSREMEQCIALQETLTLAVHWRALVEV